MPNSEPEIRFTTAITIWFLSTKSTLASKTAIKNLTATSSAPCKKLHIATCASLPREVTQKVIEGFYPGISTAEVDTLAAETCALSKQERVGASLIGKGKFHSFFEDILIFNFVWDFLGGVDSTLKNSQSLLALWQFRCLHEPEASGFFHPSSNA